MGTRSTLLKMLIEDYGRPIMDRVMDYVDGDAPESVIRTAAERMRPALRVRPGTFDPRMEKRKGEVNKVRNLELVVTAPKARKRPKVDLRDHEGRGIITSFADRAAAGDRLLGVNDITFNNPVDRLGGQGYMFENPGLVWANDASAVGKHLAQARRLKQETGQDPLFAPWTMGPTAIDFAHTPREIMLRAAAETLGKRDSKTLSKHIEHLVPGFRALDDEGSIQLARYSTSRAPLNKLLDSYREKTGIGLGSARLAATDTGQNDLPLTALQSIGVIDASGRGVPSEHPSYPVSIPGEGLGDLDELIGALQVLPDLARAKGVTDPFDFPVGVVPGTLSPMRSLQMKPHKGILTHDVLMALEPKPSDFDPMPGLLRKYRGGRISKPQCGCS